MKAFLLSAACFMLFACSGSDEDNVNNGNNPGNGEVSNTLHMSFKTPDWEQFINCEQLDLYGFAVSESANAVSATSASTKETFYFSIPVDSSAMVAPGNLKKYAITGYGDNVNPFEFSQKLPITQGSATYLISSPGFGTDDYNEVVDIQYIGSEPNNAVFKVKCRYAMHAYELGNSQNIKPITGTFHFKVRTSKN
ncbi:hypothetical protein [Flavobacterium suzhouense]|uniref:Lipoprotein n=1 Tax=Flavobacterium suzhouense TaxID=1529638 RepID=A0ABW5NSF0_9FLAO